MTGSRRGAGRERWARLENERRDTAYQASLARWRWRDAELRSLLAAATTTQPAREGDWSEWLDPAVDEAVYWTAGGAGMVEAPYVTRLRPPHHREFGRAEEPPAGPSADTGQVAVTDRRVVFAGRERHEWPYATLIGMAHTTAGETWLLVTSARTVSGVAGPAAAEFRLYLALALADRAGERDAFVAELAEQVEQHQRAKPEPPVPATAGQAPHPPRLSRRGRLQAAVAASAALGSLFAIAALVGDDPRPESFSASAESPAGSSPPPVTAPANAPPVTAPESPVPGAESPEPPRTEPLHQAVPPQQLPPPPPPSRSPSPSPSPSPSADTVDPWFPNCDEANENGYGPYFRDRDPEYWWYPDRNHDGVVCRP